MKQEEEIAKIKRITELTRQHNALKGTMNTLKAEDETIKSEIKLHLRELGVDKAEDLDGNLITYREQTRETIDKNRVKEILGEDRFEEVVKSTTFESLRITSKEQMEMLKKRNGGKEK